MASGRTPPSVLITVKGAVASAKSKHLDKPPEHSYSGSGYVLDAQKGIVATSATWLSDLLHIHLMGREERSMEDNHLPMIQSSAPSDHHLKMLHAQSLGEHAQTIKWEMAFGDQIHFQVLLQEQLAIPPCDDGKGCNLVNGKQPGLQGYASEQQKEGKVVLQEAQIYGVYLMSSVYSTLKEQLSSLAHWRVSKGQRHSWEEPSTLVVNEYDLSSLLLPLSCVVLLRVHGFHSAR